MAAEILREEGIVTEIKNNQMKIELINTTNCDTCSTKDFCKSGKSNFIQTKYENNYKVGDEVVIEVFGKDVLKIVWLLYGIPIIILLASLFITYFSIDFKREIYSVLVSFSSAGIYYLFLSFYLKDIQSLDKIKISRKNS